MERQEFGRRLNEAIKMSGLTIKDIAEKMEVDGALICHYKSGRYCPSIFYLKKLCQILDVSADYMLGLKEYP